MDLSDLPTEYVLRPGLLSTLAQLAAAGLFAAVGVHAVRDPTFMARFKSAFWNRVASWFILLLFGSFFVLCALMSVFPSSNGLFLDQTGFSDSRLWMGRRRRWDHVSEFRVVPKDNPDDWVISWFYVPTTIEYRVDHPSLRPSDRGIETLDGGYGRSDHEVVGLLNAWRARALNQPAR